MIAVNTWNYGGTSATIEQEDNSATIWYEVCDACCELESTERFEPHVHIFNPAILVHRQSQTNRKTFKGVSGCPPINRGRHWNRKART
jgi:hypothetical protein